MDCNCESIICFMDKHAQGLGGLIFAVCFLLVTVTILCIMKRPTK